MVTVLLLDMQGAIKAMGRTYNDANGEAAIAKLTEVYKSFHADLDKQVVLRTPVPRLKRGATNQGVAKSIDKAYEGWQEFLKSIDMKLD